MKILLERGDVSPNSSDKNGRTPLSYAARYGCEGTAKILLERRDVNPDSSDNGGRTPLSYAAESGHGGVMKILLERGDVNADSSDEYGLTPLSYAARSGQEDVGKILLERRDVNPDLCDNDGRTPLSHAARGWGDGAVLFGLSRNVGIVNILLARGDVNPDSSDQYGRTPLSYAAGYGHEGVVKILLERGDVNPNSWDKYARTPLWYAERSWNFDVMKLLSEPRPSSHQTSQTSGLRVKIPGPALCGEEGVELGPVSQQGVISDIRHASTAAAPLAPSDESPLNQLDVHPSAPPLTLISTSNTNPNSTTAKPPWRLKRHGGTQPLLRRSKRKRLSSY